MDRVYFKTLSRLNPSYAVPCWFFDKHISSPIISGNEAASCCGYHFSLWHSDSSQIHFRFLRHYFPSSKGCISSCLSGLLATFLNRLEIMRNLPFVWDQVVGRKYHHILNYFPSKLLLSFNLNL